MKVYVNSEHHICAVHTTRDQNLTLFEIPDNTFPENATDDLIKCYSCWGDENGNYIIQLLVPADMVNQINQIGLQRKTDQEEILALQLALTEQYEENLILSEEITNTQLALTEIYEGMEV